MITHNFSHLIFGNNADAKSYARVKKTFSVNGAGQTGCPHAKA